MPSKTKKGKKVSRGLIKGISHEVRMDVLRVLHEREASPNEVAKQVGEELKAVSYHVKVLRDDGAIELVRTEPRRGAVEHYYRATTAAKFKKRQWAEVPASARRRISRTLLQVLFSEAALAEHRGTLDARVDRHLSWMPFSVDERGWKELTEILAEALGRIERVKDASAERLKESDQNGSPVIAALMGFERAARTKGEKR